MEQAMSQAGAVCVQGWPWADVQLKSGRTQACSFDMFEDQSMHITRSQQCGPDPLQDFSTERCMRLIALMRLRCRVGFDIICTPTNWQVMLSCCFRCWLFWKNHQRAKIRARREHHRQRTVSLQLLQQPQPRSPKSIPDIASCMSAGLSSLLASYSERVLYICIVLPALPLRPDVKAHTHIDPDHNAGT